jgi:hypothetical protein
MAEGGTRAHAGAFCLFAALAFALVDHGVPLTDHLAGQGSDPADSVWFMAWWPYALSHHLDPFYTNLMWYPAGVSLAWVTAVPALSLLGWPVTAWAGPAVTYDLYVILAPMLAAWTAYLLCFHLTRNVTAALIGGFLFGFSGYETAQNTAALNLSFCAGVPALTLLVLLRLDDRIGRARFAALVALILIAQFLICIELFAMIFVFGGITWVAALRLLPARRAALARLVTDALCAAPAVFLVALPFFISMWRHRGYANHPALWPYYFTGDLLNFIIPTPSNLFGFLFTPITDHFNLSEQEHDAYIGLPLLIILVLFAREGGARLLVTLLVVFVLLSFGPALWVDGDYTGLIMPWSLFVHVPLIGQALPARFALFVALVAAMMAALWVARGGRGRLALGLLACLALLPRLHPWSPLPDAAFFRPGRVEAVLGPAPRLLVLPFALHGPSSYWQQESQFGFTQASGFLGFPPAAMQHFAAIGEMFGPHLSAKFPAEFVAYCQQSGAQAVVAGPGTTPDLLAVLDALGWPKRAVDDVVIYTVPAAARG